MFKKRDLFTLCVTTTLALGVALPALAATVLPAGFAGKGIGAGTGSITDDGTTLTIKGAGADIPDDTADSCYFVSMPVTGDGNITARLTSATGGAPDGGEKVGPMIRETLDADSAHALFNETNDNHGESFTHRDTKGDSGIHEPGYAPRQFPIWMRTQRVGNNLTGFYSWDGQLWVPTNSQIVTMGQNTNFGLAVASHDDGVTMTTTWDNVSINPGQVQVTGLNACGAAAAVMLNWSAVAGAKGYNIFRGKPGVALNDAMMSQLTPLSTSAVTGTSFMDTSADLAMGTRQVYAVAAVGADGKQGPLTAVIGGAAVNPASPLPNYTVTVFGNHTEGTCKGLGTSLGAFMDAATGAITLRGGGFDVWNDAEDFVFLSTKITGNARMTVQLLEAPLGISTCCSKSGLMVREGLAPKARYVMATALSYAPEGLLQQHRTDSTTPDDNQSGDSGIDGPGLTAALQGKGMFLQVVRMGDNISTNFSIDGKTFTPISSTDNPFMLPNLTADVQIGLVVAARDRDAVIQNRLSEVKFKIISIEKL
jgi:hypothetical protein